MGFGVLEGPCRVWGPWVCRVGVCVCGISEVGDPSRVWEPLWSWGTLQDLGSLEDLTGCGGNKRGPAASSPQRQRVQSSRCGAGPLPQGCPKALWAPSRTTGGTQPRTTAPVPAFILSVPHTSLGANKRAGGCPASTTSRRGFQLQASTLRRQRAEEGCSLP